jgi:hypothetical protein
VPVTPPAADPEEDAADDAAFLPVRDGEKVREVAPAQSSRQWRENVGVWIQLGKSGMAVTFPPARLALSFLGLPHHWGSDGNCSVHGKGRGFVCSGLTSRIMRQYAKFSGHGTTSSMWNTLGTPVKLSQIQPGDVIFWEAGHIHHTGMYIGGRRYDHAHW